MYHAPLSTLWRVFPDAAGKEAGRRKPKKSNGGFGMVPYLPTLLISCGEGQTRARGCWAGPAHVLGENYIPFSQKRQHHDVMVAAAFGSSSLG